MYKFVFLNALLGWENIVELLLEAKNISPSLIMMMATQSDIDWQCLVLDQNLTDPIWKEEHFLINWASERDIIVWRTGDLKLVDKIKWVF